MPHRMWRFRVGDILGAIRQVQAYTDGMDLDSLARNALVVDAVLYRIAIIGEAVGAIPEEVRALDDRIPWRAIQDMRNRLVHEYFGVRIETVWQTVKEDLPSLVGPMSALLNERDE